MMLSRLSLSFDRVVGPPLSLSLSLPGLEGQADANPPARARAPACLGGREHLSLTLSPVRGAASGFSVFHFWTSPSVMLSSRVYRNGPSRHCNRLVRSEPRGDPKAKASTLVLDLSSHCLEHRALRG